MSKQHRLKTAWWYLCIWKYVLLLSKDAVSKCNSKILSSCCLLTVTFWQSVSVSTLYDAIRPINICHCHQKPWNTQLRWPRYYSKILASGGDLIQVELKQSPRVFLAQTTTLAQTRKIQLCIAWTFYLPIQLLIFYYYVLYTTRIFSKNTYRSLRRTHLYTIVFLAETN